MNQLCITFADRHPVCKKESCMKLLEMQIKEHKWTILFIKKQTKAFFGEILHPKSFKDFLFLHLNQIIKFNLKIIRQ